MNFLKIGLNMRNYLRIDTMCLVIFLVFVYLSHSKFGKKNDGSIKMILGDDFSGIVDIIWAEEFPMKMIDKSKDGKL